MDGKIKNWLKKPIDWKLEIPIGLLIMLGRGLWAIFGLIVFIYGLVSLNKWDKARRTKKLENKKIN